MQWNNTMLNIFNHWLCCNFSWRALIICGDLFYRGIVNIFVQAPRILGLMWAALSPFSILYLRNLPAKLARLGWWIAYFYNFMALALTLLWLDCGYERKTCSWGDSPGFIATFDWCSVHPLRALFKLQHLPLMFNCSIHIIAKSMLFTSKCSTLPCCCKSCRQKLLSDLFKARSLSATKCATCISMQN